MGEAGVLETSKKGNLVSGRKWGSAKPQEISSIPAFKYKICKGEIGIMNISLYATFIFRNECIESLLKRVAHESEFVC